MILEFAQENPSLHILVLQGCIYILVLQGFIYILFLKGC